MSHSRRALLISAMFPPHTGAATHRLRLLAPHLPEFGWEPTVLTVEPEVYGERLEPELLKLVPPWLRVERVSAIPLSWTRPLGVGDVGLRSLAQTVRRAAALLRRERYDVVFVSVPSHYTGLVAPLLKLRHRVPLVLDYVDPWVGAWGKTVGAGPGGSVDFKSKASRWAGLLLEGLVLGVADGVVAVSARTYQEALARVPWARPRAQAELPFGSEPADFAHARAHPRANPFFDPSDGSYHLVYVGTLLPLGFETLEVVLRSAARLRCERPELGERLRLHFFGTSNQTDPGSACRVLPVAERCGVADMVREVAPRIDYLDALTVLSQASAILLMGSSERHYTASKLYPALMAQRPLLAVYHEASVVSSTLRDGGRPPTVRLVEYDDHRRAAACEQELVAAMAALVQGPGYRAEDVDLDGMLHSARDLAGVLAEVFNAVAAAAPAAS